MLLQLVLSSIAMFYLLVLKLPAGVRKLLEGLMRRILWKGLELRVSMEMIPISWEVICKPLKLGRLGVLLLT